MTSSTQPSSSSIQNSKKSSTLISQKVKYLLSLLDKNPSQNNNEDDEWILTVLLLLNRLDYTFTDENNDEQQHILFLYKNSIVKLFHFMQCALHGYTSILQRAPNNENGKKTMEIDEYNAYLSVVAQVLSSFSSFPSKYQSIWMKLSHFVCDALHQRTLSKIRLEKVDVDLLLFLRGLVVAKQSFRVTTENNTALSEERGSNWDIEKEEEVVILLQRNKFAVENRDSINDENVPTNNILAATTSDENENGTKIDREKDFIVNLIHSILNSSKHEQQIKELYQEELSIYLQLHLLDPNVKISKSCLSHLFENVLHLHHNKENQQQGKTKTELYKIALMYLMHSCSGGMMHKAPEREKDWSLISMLQNIKNIDGKDMALVDQIRPLFMLGIIVYSSHAENENYENIDEDTNVRQLLYQAISTVMEACGCRWIMSSSTNNSSSTKDNGNDKNLGCASELCALLRMACGEVRIELGRILLLVEDDNNVEEKDREEINRNSSKMEGKMDTNKSPSSLLLKEEGEKRVESIILVQSCASIIVCALNFMIELADEEEEDSKDGEKGKNIPKMTTEAILHIRQSILDAENAIVQYLSSPSVLASFFNVDTVDNNTSTGKKNRIAKKTALVCYPAFAVYLQNVDILSLQRETSAGGTASTEAADANVMIEAVKNGIELCHSTWSKQDEYHSEEALSSLLECLSTILASSTDSRDVQFVQQTLMRDDAILAAVFFFVDQLLVTFTATERTARKSEAKGEEILADLSSCLLIMKEWVRINNRNSWKTDREGDPKIEVRDVSEKLKHWLKEILTQASLRSSVANDDVNDRWELVMSFLSELLEWFSLLQMKDISNAEDESSRDSATMNLITQAHNLLLQFDKSHA